MKNIDIWQKIYELNNRLKAQLNSRSKYDKFVFDLPELYKETRFLQ